MKRPKQVQTNFRTTPDLKQRLEAAAEVSGLTFNKEVNRRLEASLSAPEDLDQTRVPGLLAVAVAMNTAGQFASFQSSLSQQSPPAPWWNDPYAYDQAVRAANRIFESLRPAGKIANPPFMTGRAGALNLDDVAEHFGAGIANGVLSEIASEEPTSGVAIARAPKLRRDLGEDLIARVRAFIQAARRKSK